MEKTKNYGLPILQPMEINSAVKLNEAMLMLDAFAGVIVVNGFIQINTLELEQKCKELNNDAKYILADEERSISYYLHEHKTWHWIKPKKGMLVFVLQINSFMIYTGDEWQQITNSPISLSEKDRFISKPSDFNIDRASNRIYITLNEDQEIDISKIPFDQFQIIIKQEGEKPCSIKWLGENIIWKQNIIYTHTSGESSVDLIEFYQIAEPKKFFAHIISATY